MAVSCHFREHVIKPDKAIYTMLLERYNLVADECAFIDDTERNIVAANQLGIHGIIHNSYEETSEELKSLEYVNIP